MKPDPPSSGDGIWLKNYPFSVKTEHVIIQYLRMRPGDRSGSEVDALTGYDCRNVIVDHCSMSWSVDECCSVYSSGSTTVQWCLISESLYDSKQKKGPHGYGGIWGGMSASFHHNLFAHHSSRLPRLSGSRNHHHPELELVDFRYNVIYN